jgi:gamma-glutamyl-gamma-aminobutyrate hydrolase PuuD
VRLVSGYFQDFYPFHKWACFDSLAHATHPEELKEGDALVIWGGEDISPLLYKKPLSSRGGGSVPPSRRDMVEWALMKRAQELKVPILGMCRGAQMLCALAGGHLLQDVNKHGMYPWGVPHEMLASIKQPLSTTRYEVENLVDIPEEPEFVYFPEVKGYAVQWHPEYMDAECEATQFVFNEFVKREHHV